MYNMPVRIIGYRRRGPGGRLRKPRMSNLRRTMLGRRPRTLQQMIAKVLKGNSETKYVSNAYSTNTAIFTANWSAPTNLTASGSYYPALPAVQQGVGDFQRVGNKIMPTKLYTDLEVGYTAKDVSCNEVIVTIYYGTSKSGGTWQAGTPIQSAADLLDNGDGTTGPFVGQKSDLLYPINKAAHTAKQITFKLGKTSGVLNDNGNFNLLNGAYATSNGGSFKKLRLNFKPPKSLVYDQTGYVWPSNYAPWWAISFCRVDDQATSSVLDKDRINVSSLNHMYFKDV